VHNSAKLQKDSSTPPTCNTTGARQRGLTNMCS
jgi:hypothetical protein